MTEKLNIETKDVEKTTSDVSTKEAPKTTAKKAPAKKPEKLRVTQIDKSLEIAFRNNVNGTLVYKCPKHGTTYILGEFGDEDYMTFDEVLTMKNTARVFLENYWLILTEVIDGEYTIAQIREALGIDYLYNGDNSAVLDIDKFISGNVDTFKTKFPKLDEKIQDIIINRASALYKRNEISDIELIKFLTEYTGERELFSF